MPDTTAPKPRGRVHPDPVIDGQALRRARRATRKTTRQVAEEATARGVPVDRGNLGRAERGEIGGLGVDKAGVVAEVLGVDVASFLTARGRELMGLKEHAA